MCTMEETYSAMDVISVWGSVEWERLSQGSQRLVLVPYWVGMVLFV